MKSKNLKENAINDYDKIVKFVIKDMRLGYRYDDLYDVGVIGFVKGLNTYDEDKGTKYSTYLYECIKNEILQYLEQENMKKRQSEIVSLNSYILDDIELIDVIPCYVNYDEKLYLDEMFHDINNRLSFLKERDEMIFKHIYGIDGYKKLTIEELQKKFKMSKQNIQRIKIKILKILRYEMITKYYKTYQDLLLNKNKQI